MLKDGTQLEGELIVLTNCYFIAGTVFQDWQVETLEDGRRDVIELLVREFEPFSTLHSPWPLARTSYFGLTERK